MVAFRSLSIVATVDPESGLMTTFIQDVIAFAEEEGRAMELLLVDDFAALSSSFFDAFRLPENLCARIVDNPRGGGQGGALVSGILLSRGDIIVVIDPDMHENIPDIRRMLAQHEAGAQLVYTNRILRGDTSVLRRAMSFLFNAVVRKVAGIQAHDINTPMASVTSRAAKTLGSLKGSVESYKFQMYFKFSKNFAEVDISVSGRYKKKRSNYDYSVLVSLFFRRIFELSRVLLVLGRRGSLP